MLRPLRKMYCDDEALEHSRVYIIQAGGGVFRFLSIVVVSSSNVLRRLYMSDSHRGSRMTSDSNPEPFPFQTATRIVRYTFSLKS